MSRLHPSFQHEIMSNCESYMSKLLKKKSDKPRSTTRDRPSCRSGNQAQVSRIPNAKNSVVPFIKIEDKQDASADQELVHKEVINNKMAQVEVTVRTVTARNRSRSNSLSVEKREREPWGKLLQYRKSSENILASSNFDYALGTIHFLSKELQQKLQNICPGDPSLQQIVNDIQHTLYRLNPEIISERSQENLILGPKENCGDSDFNNLIKKDASEKLVLKPLKLSQSTQTILIGDTESNNQKQIEDNILKLETNCKEMEATCTKLKAEKDEMELQLQLEKEGAKKLKEESDAQLSEQNEKSQQIINRLQEERDALENQLKESKNVQDDESSNCQELQTVIQKLRDDNTVIEFENMNMKHEMTIMKLEKEKMSFLLESRDKQLKALRNEIEGIQSLVCSQLLDLKTTCYSSTTSRSSVESKSWKPSLRKKNEKKDKPIQELFLNKMKSQYQNFTPDNASSTIVNDEGLSKIETLLSFKSRADFQDEFPQRDVPPSKVSLKKFPIGSKTVSSDLTITSESADLAKEDLETNIKEMFTELKRQSLVVTLNSPPPHPFKDTASSVDSHIS